MQPPDSYDFSLINTKSDAHLGIVFCLFCVLTAAKAVRYDAAMTMLDLQNELRSLPAQDRLQLAHWLLESVLQRGEKAVAEETSSDSADSDFFALSGVWADRDITQASIRAQAWRQPTT